MELFDRVKIKSSGITGIIVDILDDQFTVEPDEERKAEPMGIIHLYSC